MKSSEISAGMKIAKRQGNLLICIKIKLTCEFVGTKIQINKNWKDSKDYFHYKLETLCRNSIRFETWKRKTPSMQNMDWNSLEGNQNLWCSSFAYDIEKVSYPLATISIRMHYHPFAKCFIKTSTWRFITQLLYTYAVQMK